MVSTSGSTLLPQSATNAYLTCLLPYTTLLTPNIPEAQLLGKLTGIECNEVAKSLSSRQVLVTSLARATKRADRVSERWVLLKGGHAPVERNGKVVVIDMLASDSRDDIVEFVSEFSESKNTHGTGCTLACIASSSGTDCSGYRGEYCNGI
jgi:hydroxymethylpyrimidine/phosphomethylpyrimidine kinase